MEYEWDERKREANIAKHGVDFTEAEQFDWTTAIEAKDNRFDYKEARWVGFGCIDKRVHVLIYTERNGKIRLISLRRANRRARDFHENKQT